MTSTTPTTLLGGIEQQVETQLQFALQTLQNLDPATLLKARADGGWSIAQCLEHLNTYGRYYLPLIAKKMQNKTADPKPFKSGWLGAYFTNMMRTPAAKKPMKAAKMHLPAPKLDAAAVVAEFIQQQEQLLSLLRQAAQVDLNGNRIPISIFKLIRLKLGDVLLFLVAHNERHLLQAKG